MSRQPLPSGFPLDLVLPNYRTLFQKGGIYTTAVSSVVLAHIDRRIRPTPEISEMDLRNNLFGKGPRGGLPGRPTQGGPGGGPPAPSPGYDNSRNYGAPSPAMRGQQRASGGYGNAPPPSSYAPPTRAVRLRLAKVEDKTLQQKYIFSNMFVFLRCSSSVLRFLPFLLEGGLTGSVTAAPYLPMTFRRLETAPICTSA